MKDTHIPVLAKESIEALAIKPSGFYVDCTFGRGGHSKLILDRLGADGKLMVIDRDHLAIKSAKDLAQKDKRIIVKTGSFKNLYDFAQEEKVVGKIDGIFLDLGVSSPQLDDPKRGFSFMHDGPLDMRMDSTQEISAKEWVNSASQDEIINVLKVYGEERFAKRIASAIIEVRKSKPISTTRQLADLISSSIPKKEKNKHPATRSFQAIRIFVNKELEDLNILLDDVLKLLAKGGRIAVISFHSLEDRIIKQFIKTHSSGDKYPKDLPIKYDLIKPDLIKIGKFILPSTSEIEDNPRARSAKLRIAEKT